MAIFGRSRAETHRGESFLRLARGVGALLAATPRRIVDVFGRLNVELLSTLDAGAERLGEGDVRCLALASLALEHAKEKAGLERARLGAAFVGAGPDDDDRVALAELVASQA